MARRQPPKTGITDWISDVTDVFRPGPRPNEMRQVTQFRDTTRNVVQTGAAAIDTTFSGGLAGSFYRNIQQPAAFIGSPNERSRMEREGLKALSKDAATTAATAAVGGAVGGAIARGVATGRIVNPAAALSNVISGQKVIVHGSPTRGLTNLQPSLGSRLLPNDKVLFGYDPQKGGIEKITREARNRYARDRSIAGSTPSGSVYVSRVDKGGTAPISASAGRASEKVNPDWAHPVTTSTGSGRVVSEIPASLPQNQVRDQLSKELRRAGVFPRVGDANITAGIPKQVLQQAGQRIMQTRTAKEIRYQLTVRKPILTENELYLAQVRRTHYPKRPR